MKELIDTYKKVNNDFIGNSNSLHKLGTESKKLEDAATKQIIDILNLNNKEIIYTSGRCESNNLAIQGLLEKYKNKNMKIITSENENSSIFESLKYLKQFNFEIKYINIKDNFIDIESLKKELDNDTILISLSNYENINEVIKLKELHKRLHLHIDKAFDNNFDFNDTDFVTIELSNLPGISCLIKDKNITIEPLLHGGKSTTKSRSGTPALPLIVIFSKALKLSINEK